MEKLRCLTQNYAWGSRDAIAALRGEAPTDRPEAEVWAGAHPLASSTIFRDGAWVRLDRVIAQDPVAELGHEVAAAFAGRLPFLVKILAAGSPLSLQTHPDHPTAQTGFRRENSAGLPLDARNRTYKDASAKPEILIALTSFEGICGFRPVAETLALLASLQVKRLDPLHDILQRSPDRDGLRAIVEHLFALPADDRTALVADIVHAAASYSGTHHNLMGWLPRLQTMYPGDIGIALSLLLNYVSLAPGESLFLEAGNLHAYLSGLGVEVMANSDNVLRAGFTEKHIDVAELLAITDFTPLPDPLFHARGDATVTSFCPPVPEFMVRRVDLAGTFAITTTGPMIVLCTAGAVNDLRPTEAAFARPGTHELSGHATCWLVTVSDG